MTFLFCRVVGPRPDYNNRSRTTKTRVRVVSDEPEPQTRRLVFVKYLVNEIYFSKTLVLLSSVLLWKIQTWVLLIVVTGSVSMMCKGRVNDTH